MGENSLSLLISSSTLAILLLLSVIIIAFFKINSQKLKQQMREQELKLQFQEELRNAEHQVSETIMHHLAYELHDDIQHLLTHVRLKLEVIMEEQPELRDKLEPMENMVFDSIEQIRSLSKRLDSDYLSDLSFEDAIQMEVDKLMRTKKFSIDFKRLATVPHLEKSQFLMAYRIFQEIVLNVIKHSKASMVTIETGGNPFFLEVKDNGIGFNLTDLNKDSKANGLKHMKRRADMGKFVINFKTAPKEGCSCQLSLKEKNTIN